MAINKTPVPDARLNMKIRAHFLDHLAETANVSASARAAGVASSAVYAERRRSPAFREAWALALAEGYARLETDLLAEALQTASGRTADGTLKARAQKPLGDCFAQRAPCVREGWRCCRHRVQARAAGFGDVKGAIDPEAHANAATR